MKKVASFPYIALFLFLLFWTSLSRPYSDAIRSFSTASLAPSWRWALGVKNYLSDRPILESKKGDPSEIAQLRVENQNLKNQIRWAREWILSERKWGDELENRGFSQENRASFLTDLLYRQLASVPARVIYRDPSSWSSTLWINVGEEDNHLLNRALVAKNSPVISGTSLIGVIDYVGKKQSRVRLITDSGVSPAVRAVRGFSQNRELVLLIESIVDRLQLRKDLFSTSPEKELLLKELFSLKEKMGKEKEDVYLVKGELHGSSAPFWRSRGPILKGIGFNYDYPDEEGPARDLRSGRPLNGRGQPLTLLKEGDLLMTSGLDGLFPPGLAVATVLSIGPLKQGAYAYELQAIPTAHHLNDLESVFVLPSLSGEE
jgi:rod shape-determining protein MreC